MDVVSGDTCSDLADYPVETDGSVGANIDGTPVICGGYTNTNTKNNKCYKLTNVGWQEFASMKDAREYAVGVVYMNKLHVFGGFADGSRLQTTELISMDGGVEYGPDLQASVFYNAITSINTTVSILSGGWTSNYVWTSSLTWYFNHDTGVFSSGPSLLEGRSSHGSATNVDKVTKARIAVVAGGLSSNLDSLDSTEMLINGQWQSGTIQ